MSDDMDQIGNKVFSKRTAALLLFCALVVKYYKLIIGIIVVSTLAVMFWNGTHA